MNRMPRFTAAFCCWSNQTDGAKEYIHVAKRGPIYAEEKRVLEDELAKSRRFT